MAGQTPHGQALQRQSEADHCICIFIVQTDFVFTLSEIASTLDAVKLRTSQKTLKLCWIWFDPCTSWCVSERHKNQQKQQKQERNILNTVCTYIYLRHVCVTNWKTDLEWVYLCFEPSEVESRRVSARLRHFQGHGRCTGKAGKAHDEVRSLQPWAWFQYRFDFRSKREKMNPIELGLFIPFRFKKHHLGYVCYLTFPDIPLVFSLDQRFLEVGSQPESKRRLWWWDMRSGNKLRLGRQELWQ